MPYSGPGDKSLPANVKKLPTAKKKQWVAIWNNSFSTCINAGGDTKSCETKAFKAANGAVETATKIAKPKKKPGVDPGITITPGPLTQTIKTVDSWSGSASNYASTEAYCAACLIDLNPSGQAKTQELCKLPVRGPGDKAGTYVDKAVHAAAARFGSMTKPSSVSATAWSSAKKTAASKLIAAYGQMKEDAPASLYTAAGKKAPMKQTITPRLRQLWDVFVEGFKTDLGQETEIVDRAVAFNQMKEQLWNSLESSDQVNSGGMAWPYDIFYDGANGIFAIVSQGGKFYQIPVDVSDSGLTLGEWTQVTEVFEPVQQNTVRIIRQADGRHRWLGVVASSVLNRVGEIDSSALFDSFIADVEETGNYPKLDFYHQGRYNSKAWEFGVADFHVREGCCYLASGLFDEEHPLAQAAIRAYEEDPEKWGFSIEFYAFGEPEVVVVKPEVRVPVYKKGRIIRISIVREADAASLFTRIGNITEEKIRMKRDTVNALAEFFGTDEAAKKFLDSFEVEVDEINRTITDDNLVHRAKEAKGEQTEVGTEDEEDTQPEPVLELDEEAMAELTEQVVASPVFQTITDGLGAIQKTLDALVAASAANSVEIATLKTEAKKAATRLALVEKDETTKKKEYLEDVPAKRGRTATFRPREEYATEEDEEENTDDFESVAQRTLAKIPRRY